MGSLSSLEHMALLEPALWGAGGIDGVIDVVLHILIPEKNAPTGSSIASKRANKNKIGR